MKPLFIASFLEPEEIKSNILSFVAKIVTTRGALQQVTNAAPATSGDFPTTTARALTLDPNLHSISINSVITQDLDSKDPFASFGSMLSKIPQDTQEMDMIIIGHGTIVGNEHFIVFSKQDAHLNVSCMVRTKDLFSKIATALPNTKVSILFDSCFGGMAQAHKDALTIGSSLYSLSSDETVLASMPTNKTLENYPDGLDYSPESFIIRLLSQRVFHFACTKTDIPHHLVEMIPERIIRGTPGNDYTKMYVYDTRKIDKDVFKKAMIALQGAMGDDNSMIGFLKALHLTQSTEIEWEATKTIHMAKHDNLLSLLAFITDTGVAFKPNAQFANSMQSNIRFNITFDQYDLLFHANHQKDFSNPSIMDLLVNRYQDHSMTLSNSDKKHTDIAIDALIKKITSNSEDISNPYAAVNILCDITKDHLGEHFLRIGLVVNELNTVSLMVIPMSDTDLSELLSGSITSTYDYFVAKLHTTDLSKIFLDMVIPNLAQDVGEKVGEIVPKLEAIGNILVAKLNKSVDKFGTNFCKQLDQAVANMVKFHERAVFTPTDDMDLVKHYADYLKPSHVDVVELAGTSIKYDMNLGEFME